MKNVCWNLTSPSKNYVRCFLFHLKSSFCSWDIQFFVFPSYPLFRPVRHCFRALSKINLKVYNVMNCLNKNLITFCLISWQGKKVWHWNFVQIVLRHIFMEKSYRKCATKASPRLLFYFGKQPKTAIACKKFF